jgi:Transposase
MEGDECWLLGAHGHLIRIDLRSADELGQIDAQSDFGLKEPLEWGLCGSPLMGISEQTWYRWRTKCDGMDPQMARQLQELQKENARLKRLVADQALDNLIPREAARPN